MMLCVYQRISPFHLNFQVHMCRVVCSVSFSPFAVFRVCSLKKKKNPFNSWYWKIVSSYFSPFFFSVVKGLPILLIFPKSQPTLRFIEFLYHFSLLNVIAFTCILIVAFLFLALCLFHSSYFRFFRWKLGLLIWDCTLLTYLFGARKVLVSPTSPGPYKCSHTDALQFTRELHPVKPIRSQNYCKVKTHLIHVTYQTS